MASIKPRWCARDKAWLVPLGEVSEVTGRHKYVVLRDTEGRKITGNDHIGKIKALQRLLNHKVAGPTVESIIRGYIAWHERRGSKQTTVQDHLFHLNRFGEFVHNGGAYWYRPASSISLRDLSRVRTSMESRGCKSGYIRHLYSSVLACWRWATRPIEGRDPERLLETNPLEGAERPRVGRNRKLVVPWSTIERLIQFAEERASKTRFAIQAAASRKVLMLRLIAESGCRPIEACRLEWTWVDEEKRVIVIPADQHKTGHHGGGDRIFGLTEGMATHLKDLRERYFAYPRWVFALGGQTQPPSRHGFDHWFAELRRSAIAGGIPIPPTMTLYSLRHSLVTQAHQGGVSYRDLAHHMGHSEQVAEQVYSHLDPQHVVAQFDKMHTARQTPGS